METGDRRPGRDFRSDSRRLQEVFRVQVASPPSSARADSLDHKSREEKPLEMRRFCPPQLRVALGRRAPYRCRTNLRSGLETPRAPSTLRNTDGIETDLRDAARWTI